MSPFEVILSFAILVFGGILWNQGQEVKRMKRFYGRWMRCQGIAIVRIKAQMKAMQKVDTELVDRFLETKVAEKDLKKTVIRAMEEVSK